MTPRRLLVLAVLALALACPATAQAHAVLEATSPARGAQLQHAPERVVFRFGEPVEASFGSVRVYDGDGNRVDSGSAEHPGGRGDAIAVGLRGGLRDGTYTATYRVISADSHPVVGGFVFTVGRGGTPAETLDQLIDAGGAGHVTELGFGIVRALSYLALALGAGAVAFVLAVWRPALAATGGAGEAWERARHAFVRRTRLILMGSAVLGASMSALGLVFQGAIAAGTSVWTALDPGVIEDVLHTRFGTVWVLRLGAWSVVGALLAVRAPRRSRVAALTMVALLGFLCLTPALGGHAATLDDAWALVPANFLHVLAMAVWVGGVVLLLLALPAATRLLPPEHRTSLLAAVVARFSTLALCAVAVLVATGTVQAILDLHALDDLLHTAFGRAILVKIGLLAGLIGLGAWNSRRARPRLEALAASGAGPGAAGVGLRRSLRAELVLMLAVLAVTSALVSYAPPVGATGPVSEDAVLGPARLELTVDPARVGRNQVHLYLFDRRTGRQWDRAKELTVTARLPDEDIGPLALRPQKAGPGHYVIRRAGLAPKGEWQLRITARVSAFDEYVARIEVPIR